MDVSDTELINELTRFEQGFKDTDIWFRFFTHDTLATSILDVERALSDSNRSYMIESIDMALNNPDGFELNFDTYKH
jgi:hypothetical protein